MSPQARRVIISCKKAKISKFRRITQAHMSPLLSGIWGGYHLLLQTQNPHKLGPVNMQKSRVQ